MATVDANIINMSKIENVMMEINEMSDVSFFITSFSIPGLSIGSVNTPNPFKTHSEPGKKLTYENLSVTFMVDEDFNTWKKITDWVMEGSNGYTFDTQSISRRSGNLMIMTNNMNPKYRIQIKNMFPISVDSIEIDVQQSDPVPLTFNADFIYESYSFEIV